MDKLMVTETDWQTRLDDVVELMRDVSLQTDPQEMVRAYGRHMGRLFPTDRRISLSRRGLTFPRFRVTRFSEWKEDINPWKQPERLPLLQGGLFAELIYSDTPHIIDDLSIAPDDPAAPYLEGQRSLIAIPMLDRGVALNMVVLTREGPAAFDRERFPENVWLANLFGRATQNLVLSEQVREAYDMVDRELRAVADIQRALLPTRMPHIDTMELAAHYQTSQRAGGDYYDFFPLPDGRWGILIADVSGHGTPAAVVMAITHSIAHLFPGSSSKASDLLRFVNQQLSSRYTRPGGVEAFVTAFYAIYNPRTREMQYSSAGHNPPRLVQCGTTSSQALDKASSLPLGVLPELACRDETIQLQPGDRVVFYTDGITETTNPHGEMFGPARLDRVIEHTCGRPSESVLEKIIAAVDEFSEGARAADDRTVLVAQVR